jgi:alanine racemase
MTAELTINLANIKHNYHYAKTLTNEEIFAVVKTNAYGLGVQKIAQYLDNTVDGFAVATLQEALELKSFGITQKILIMLGCFNKNDLKTATHNNFIIAITTTEQAQNLLEINPTNPVQVFLKFDSGMHRLGLNEEKLINYYQEFSKKNIDITLMSHFCCSENETISKVQIQKIDNLKNKLKITQTSLSNSAGILNQLSPNSIGRMGISLYGINLTNKDHNLKPAITLKAKIIAIKDIKKGDFVGYGQTFQTQKDLKIAVVKLGYGNGYPRNIKKNTPVFVGGKKTIIIGRVSMDMITISLENINAQIFDSVEFFGENIAIEEVAISADTIPYEVFCNLKNLHYTY